MLCSSLIGWTPLHLIPKSSQPPITSTLSFLLLLHVPITTIPPFLVLSFPFFCSSPPLCSQLDCLALYSPKKAVSFGTFCMNSACLRACFLFEPHTFSSTVVVLFYWHIGLPLTSRFLLEYSLIPEILQCKTPITNKGW